jgi:hypothetical protein
MRTCLPRPLWPMPPRSKSVARHSLVAGLILGALVGCAAPPPPFVPIRHDGVRIAHCFDGVPHQPGAKPWVLGGTCCCTPTEETLKLWQRDGFFTGMGMDEVLAQYDERGIKTALDHRHCNNQCEFGPHVTRGGHCMAPPTPGTRNYEEIVTGRVAGQPTATAPATPGTGG